MNNLQTTVMSIFFGSNLTFRHFLKSSRWIWPIAALLAIGGPVFYVLMSSGQAGAAKRDVRSANNLAVEVLQVKRVTQFSRPRTFTGLVVARRSSDLAFNRPVGELTSILVDEGDQVVAGQELASLDIAQLQAHIRELQAKIKQAEAVLLELKKGPRVEKIAAAKSEVYDLQARVSQVEAEYKRSRRLLERNATSQEDHDAKRFTLQALKAQQQAAEWRYILPPKENFL